jgi:hypothetical protein
MASKKELRSEIEALCTARGASFPEGIEAMNHAELTAAFDALRLQGTSPAPLFGDGPAPGLMKVEPTPPVVTPEAALAQPAALPPSLIETPLDVAPVLPVEPPPAVTPPDQAAPPPSGSAPAPDSPEGPKSYFVAQGRMLYGTKKGKIGAFQQVKAKDLLGGEDELKALHQQGSLFTKP